MCVWRERSWFHASFWNSDNLGRAGSFSKHERMCLIADLNVAYFFHTSYNVLHILYSSQKSMRQSREGLVEGLVAKLLSCIQLLLPSVHPSHNLSHDLSLLSSGEVSESMVDLFERLAHSLQKHMR